MKMFAYIAAGCLAATAVVPAAADAQVRVRVVETHHHSNWRGHDRWRTVCRTVWRHHHRTRECHRVRW